MYCWRTLSQVVEFGIDSRLQRKKRLRERCGEKRRKKRISDEYQCVFVQVYTE